MPRKKSTEIEHKHLTADYIKRLTETALEDKLVWNATNTYLKDLPPGTKFELPGGTTGRWQLISIGIGSATVKKIGEPGTTNISLHTDVVVITDISKPQMLGSLSDLREQDDKKVQSRGRKTPKGKQSGTNQAAPKSKRKPKKAGTKRSNNRAGNRSRSSNRIPAKPAKKKSKAKK